MQYLNKLNEPQRSAVESTEGPVLIIAGAGAGKTRTITYRIAHLINKGVHPKNILAVTFTNKAASEMAERVNHILTTEPEMSAPISELERPIIRTFHSLGVQILRSHADALGFKKSFSIYDRDDSKRIVRDATKDLGFDPKDMDPGKTLSIISKQKGDKVSPDSFGINTNNYFTQNILQIWRKYEEKLKEDNAFDFDDLLVKTVELFERNHDILKIYQDQFKYIHVDEYQDTNTIQYQITKMLAHGHKNICVVGDIDQNIYSWRGASIKNMFNFNEDYPDASVIKLEENYRSTKNILKAANEVISKNAKRWEKVLFTNNHDGDPIHLYNAIDEYDEANFVVTEAKRLIKEGNSPDEIAVLYRTNFQSRVLEEVFLRENMPHQLVGTRFFERKEVKDLISYIKAAFNPDDFSATNRIINVPTRGIGKTTILKIKLKQEDTLPKPTQEKVYAFRKILTDIRDFALQNKLDATIAFALKRSSIEDRLTMEGNDGLERLLNIKELASLSKKYDHLSGEDAVNKFLEDVALASDQDSLERNNGGIKLMTVHAAKGLEFDTVFVVGMETGLFPMQRNDEKNSDTEEERRLFYVAITRARKNLYLVWATFRTIFGNKEITVQSDFLADIPTELTEQKNYGGDEKPKNKIEYLIDF